MSGDAPVPATLLDGKAIAAVVMQEVKAKVAVYTEEHGRAPALAVVLVGSRPDSALYVKMKIKACEDAGIRSQLVNIPEDATQDAVLAVVESLNADPSVNGILVQRPLPPHMDEHDVFDAIVPAKDVDGLNSRNVGLLHSLKPTHPRFSSLLIPCTPLGCMEMLKRSGVSVAGKKACVLGRSNIAGLPMATLLEKADATVTLCHSKTVDEQAAVKEADIVVVAVGRPALVRGSWIKPGAVVIDVGINNVPDATRKSGSRLCGDVAFAECRDLCSAITPVPGGVGPMTIAMLLSNTMKAAAQQD